MRVLLYIFMFLTRRLCAMPVSAIVVEAFGATEVLQLRSKELPALQPGQVRVKVEAAGVNPSDTYLRLGMSGPYAAVPHLLPQLPWTPGKDGAGVVEALGEEVESLVLGQRVYTCAGGTGTYASHANLDAAGVYPLPDSISFAEGAGVGIPCATAYYALKRRGQAVPGSRVFIHGASGAVGLAAVQLAMPRLHGHVLRLHHLGVQKSPKVKVFAVVSHRAETIQQHV
ncbi:Quinone oxidoreductase (NADPH:quinone reductase) (Zeta-crystallin) [Durusdinium trenchii]|uniref:Quinone oxidoreductase (NADPH:quinone reductase) (Zeta-crystallin) n=1 Tax=Durusdinium trenchii TaxID=1381693 RepID=A0ABP0QBI1_9DINO